MVRAAAVIVCVLAALPARADDAIARMERGEVIVQTRRKPGVQVPMVRATAIIDAPMDRVWRILDRCGEYSRTMLRIKTSEELWRKGNKVRCRVLFVMPFPLQDLWTTTDAVHTVQPGVRYVRKWKQVEGDFRFNDGSWTLTPHGDGTRTFVEYRVFADPKVELPDFVQDAARKKTLPELIDHLRTQVKPSR